LLLPGRLLQVLLGRPAVVRGRRAAQELYRRAVVPADPAERAPLLPLPRPRLPGDPPPRRLEGPVVRGPRDRPRLVRDRTRHAGAGRQRGLPRRLYAGLPLAAPPRGRRA